MRNVTFVIAVTLLKGGVGKTTTSIGLGLSLGREPRVGQVLLVDADPQASATASRVALVRRENLRATRLAETGGRAGAVASRTTFDDVYPFAQCQLAFPADGDLDRDDVLNQLADITEGHYRPTRVEDARTADGSAGDSSPIVPNVIVIDTSPAYPRILGGVLDFIASQQTALLVVPTTMSDLDIPQARQFPTVLSRSTASDVSYGLLATKFDRRRRSDLERLEALRGEHPVFNTVVPYGLPFARGPFDDHARPKSPFGRVHKSVTAEAIEMLVGKWQPAALAGNELLQARAHV